MSIEYIPRQGDELGYWIAYDPDLQDMEEMVFELGRSQWFNFVVVGVPCEISPEWLAKHPHIDEEARRDPETGKFIRDKNGKLIWDKLPDFKYEYGVSYSIQARDVGDMLDDNETVVDAFNYYLEGTGKCWREIEQLKLVDRRKPWDNAVI